MKATTIICGLILGYCIGAIVTIHLFERGHYQLNIAGRKVGFESKQELQEVFHESGRLLQEIK